MELQESQGKSSEFVRFCQEILKDTEVSIRLVAESPALLEKLAGLNGGNGSGEKNRIIKLLPRDGPLEDRVRSALEFNKRGYAVYYLPSVFEKGGYEENYAALLGYRALVIDLDGAPLGPVFSWKVSPSCIVETSAGKYQVIWAFDSLLHCNKSKVSGLGEGVTYEEFNEAMAAVSCLFEGDLNACRATQPFRAPGFIHWKKAERDSWQHSPSGETPYVSKVIWTNEETAGVRYAVLTAACEGSKGLIRERIKSRRLDKSEGFDEFRVGDYDRSCASILGEFKVDLESFLSGEVKVGQGFRHGTILSVAARLFMSGKEYAEVKKLVESGIEKCFEGASDFLGSGRRAGEVELCLRDAWKWFSKIRRQEAEERDAYLERKAKETGIIEKDLDFKSGSLAIAPYSECAIVDRCLVKFYEEFLYLPDEHRFFCFFRAKKTWVAQERGNPGGVAARIRLAVYDTVNEPEFIQLFCLDSKRRSIDTTKAERAKAEFLRSSAVGGMSRLLMMHIGVAQAKESDFDAHEELFFAANGVVNMKTGTVRDACAKDKLLRRSNVVYDPNAKCPLWEKFLGEVFAENQEPLEMVRFMQELFGYSLSGSVHEQKVFCYSGDGANGKSKTLDALKKICGEYSCIVEGEDVLGSKGPFGHAWERIGAKAEGSRVVVIDDLAVHGQWNEGFLKTLTGQEYRARAEYQWSRTVTNRNKFHIGMNVMPTPEAENKGILRRLCIIPFMRTFDASSEASARIDAMIKEEASGILAWAIRGYQRSHLKGLVYPKETILALEDYRQETFSLESALENLYDFPKQEILGVDGKVSNGSWEPLVAIIDDVSKYLHGKGNSSLVTPEVVGHALKRKKALKALKRNSELGNTLTHYLVQFKFDRKKSNSALKLL